MSLSEDPENEIPVAQQLLAHIATRAENPIGSDAEAEVVTASCGVPQVIGLDCKEAPVEAVHIAVGHPNAIGRARAAIAQAPKGKPLAVSVLYPSDMTDEQVTIAASVDLGALLLERADIAAIEIDAPQLTLERRNALALSILQATRRRMSKTEYIACPSCGRTLFDLQKTLAQVKAATASQPSLKIGVMGCIVNGPGEMADADYGYVGAGPGRVSIYRGKECVIKNIPADEALPRMIELIKADGRWCDEA
ncbi:MAG: flavodoxin-dependent (E)-4-hydroxy-3-methylbut-2-enyl-diphosphate synthase [Bradyrhizobium sp.]